MNAAPALAAGLFGSPALIPRTQRAPAPPAVGGAGDGPPRVVRTTRVKMGPGRAVREVEVAMGGLHLCLLVNGRNVLWPSLRGEQAVRFTDDAVTAAVEALAIEAGGLAT